MRLLPIRFTIRHVMVLVALVGLVLGMIVEGERRRTRFRIIAAEHLEQSMRYFVLFGGGDSEYQRRSMQLWDDMYSPIVAYHVNLHEKYEWAARFPWLPVASDPPKPPAPPWPPTDWPPPD